MSNLREYSYKIKGLNGLSDDVLNDFKAVFSGVTGVIAFNVNREEELIEYALDQWSSDYDAFSKLSEICEKYNLELLFDDDEIVEAEVKDEITPTEEEKFDEEPELIKDKLTKGDFIEKIILSCLSLCILLVGSFLNKFPNAKPWVLLVAFTVASYEILYDVVLKATDKEYVFEEVATFIGALILTYLGYTEIATVIMVLYSALLFTVSYAKHKIAVKKENLKQEIESCEDEIAKALLTEKLTYIEENDNVRSTKTLNLYSKRLTVNLCLVAVAVLATFIPPFFAIKTYWSTILSTWLYLGAGILLLGGFGECLFSLSLAEKLALLNAADNGVAINSLNEFLGLTDKEKIAFDKSGVITTDTRVEGVEGGEKALLYALSALQTENNHIAKAVRAYAKDLSPLQANEIAVTPSMGVSCIIEDKSVLVGSRRYLKDNSIAVEEMNDSLSHIYVCLGGEVIGYLILGFEIRKNTFGAIAELKNDLELTTELLSSDEGAVVTELKKQIKFDKAISGASPKFKAEKVSKENAIYVGHEVNDSQALSLVSDSIVFGDKGKIAIKDKEIRKVPFILKLARRTVKTTEFNKKFAVSLKICLIAASVLLRALSTINFIWWIFAIDVAARIFTVIKAINNSSYIA